MYDVWKGAIKTWEVSTDVGNVKKNRLELWSAWDCFGAHHVFLGLRWILLDGFDGESGKHKEPLTH